MKRMFHNLALAAVSAMPFAVVADVAVRLDVARPRAGEAITATIDGADMAAGSLSVRWYRGTAVGAYENMPVSESETYTPTEDDYGHWLKVAVSGTNAALAETAFFFSRLPVVYIDTDDGLPVVVKTEEKGANVRIQGNDVYGQQYDGRTTIKGRGNSSWGFPQKPYKLKLDKKTDLFGFGKNKHWVLISNYVDTSALRNKYGSDLAKELGITGMDMTWVDVVLNGEYNGLYMLMEHIRVDSNRVDIFDWEGEAEDVADALYDAAKKSEGWAKDDKSALEDAMVEDLSWITTGEVSYGGRRYRLADFGLCKDYDLSGGYIFELDTNYDEVSKFTTSGGLMVMVNRPEFLYTNSSMLQYVTNMWNLFENAYLSPDGYADGKHYSEMADVESMAAYWLVNGCLVNNDASSRSRYCHVEVGGKLTFGPVWDFDSGTASRTVLNPSPVQWSVARVPYSKQGMYSEWLDDPFFCLKAYELYHEKVHPWMVRLLEGGGRMDADAAYIAESGGCEDMRWGDVGGSWQDMYPYRGHADDLAAVRAFLEKRLQWLDSAFGSLDHLVSQMGRTSAGATSAPYVKDDATLGIDVENGIAVNLTGDTDFAVDANADVRIEVTVPSAEVSKVAAYVNGLAYGDFEVENGACRFTVDAAKLVATDGRRDMLMLVAKDSGGAMVARNYATFIKRYPVSFDANGGSGEMPVQAFIYGIAQPLTECAFVRTGYSFEGWATDREGGVAFADAESIVNHGAEVTLYAVWSIKSISVAQTEAVAHEGGMVSMRVVGGSAEAASSAKMQLTYQTASAADIDLAKGTVDGVTPKGGLKFPLTLSWASGEIGEKVITIPVRTDKAVEGDEFFTLQLADAVGLDVGEARVCTVTIMDRNDKNLKAAVTAYRPKKGETVSTNSVAVSVAASATLPSGAVGGFVAGTGDYTSGSKLTLTAEARPGWAFAGWALREGDGTILSDKAKWQIVVTNDAAYEAVFERIPYIRGLADPADGGKVSGSGYCAAGKKATLKATANRNFTFTGWSDGENIVAATPTLVVDRTVKPAANSNTSTTVTNVTDDATYYAIFKGDPRVTVAVDVSDGAGDAAGRIAGTGRYAPGKKVTLKATANKGYVFAEWHNSDGTVATKAASHVFTMSSNDVSMVARFVTADEDKAAITLNVDGVPCPVAETQSWTNYCGVAVDLPVASGGLTETTVKVSGLPAGLKLVQDRATKAYSVTGAPTAASKMDARTGAVMPSAVKFTVTTAGKSSQTFAVNWVVLPLPAWAVGTFNGVADGGGLVQSLAVAANGKISGKLLMDGLTWTLSAPSFSEVERPESEVERPVFHATATAKSDKIVLSSKISLAEEDGRGVVSGWMASLIIDYIAFMPDGVTWTAWQNRWKAEPWKTAAKAFAKSPQLTVDVNGGTVILKFAAAGAVTASGKFVTGVDSRGNDIVYSATCSSVLILRSESACDAYVYFPPKKDAKGNVTFAGYSALFPLEWDGAAFKLATVIGDDNQ